MSQAIAISTSKETISQKFRVISIINEVAECGVEVYPEQLIAKQQQEINLLKKKLKNLSLSLRSERLRSEGLEIDLYHAIDLLNNKEQ